MRAPLGLADEDLLFGRASEVQTIVENCERDRMTVVTSIPGLGVSSLFRAGAAPALRRSGYVTVVFSEWQGRTVSARLMEAITQAVHEQADGAFSYAGESMQALIREVREKTGKRVALLLDQFDDYLRCHSGTDVSDAFDAELSKAINAHVGRFTIGFQVEQTEEFQRFNQHVPNLMGHSFALAPLTPEAARQMIRADASRAGLEVEPDAVNLIVSAPTASVAAEEAAPGVHPLFAKLAAARLFDAENFLKSKVARASTVTANGGADRLILGSLDPAINELGSTHSELLFRWITLMLTPDGHRLPVSEDALLVHSGKWNRFAESLLPVLIKNGMLRKVEMRPGPRYEFATESMTVMVRDWWMRQEAIIVARQRRIFRISSLSLAGGAILAAYLLYLYVSLR